MFSESGRAESALGIMHGTSGTVADRGPLLTSRERVALTVLRLGSVEATMEATEARTCHREADKEESG